MGNNKFKTIIIAMGAIILLGTFFAIPAYSNTDNLKEGVCIFFDDLITFNDRINANLSCISQNLEMIYCNTYQHDDINPYVITNTDTVSYMPFANWTQGICSGMNVIGSENITTNFSGVYKLDFSFSFSGSPNQEWHFATFINDTELLECENHRFIGAGGDIGNAGGTCIINITEADEVWMGFRGVTASPRSVNFRNANFNLLKING